MSGIAWEELMRLGLTRLALSPADFWNLTPVELMLMAGGGEGRDSLTRTGLEALAARYPDGPARNIETE